MTILWVTNLPAAYRLGLWEALGNTADLRVRFLSRGETGRYWQVPAESTLDMGHLECRQFTRGETNVYMPSPGFLSDESIAKAVIVPTWESPAAWAIARWARRNGSRLILFNESTVNSSGKCSRALLSVKRRFFSSMDRIVTPGPAATQLAASMGVTRELIHEGFNCVDHQFWSLALQERHSECAGHHFLYVGQLIPRKNIGCAVSAFASIRQDFDTLTIVGNGPEHDHLASLVDTLGITNSVRFLTHCGEDNLRSIYASSDTLLLPSTVEVWGLVVNEALAAGLHVVVSNRAGVAPSVAGMRGVYLADPTENGLATEMARSRRSWRGPIHGAEILRHTFGTYAEVFRRACED